LVRGCLENVERAYTWHITFAGQTDLHRLVSEYQEALRPLSQVDLVPLEWLHLTMQGVAFTDEVSTADVDRIIDAARPPPERIAAGATDLSQAGPAT